MWNSFYILLILTVSYTWAVNVPANTFKSGLRDYFKYGSFTSEFRQVMKNVNVSHAFRTDAEQYIDNDVYCTLCDEVLDVILDEIRGGGITQEELKGAMMDLCTSLFYESLAVCQGALDLNLGIIWYIIEADPDRKSDTICGIVGQKSGCSGRPVDWSIDIAEGSSEVNKGLISEHEPIKLLHLSDIHFESLYAPGSLANCNEPMCCTGDAAENAEDAAGYWGDYRDCDSPLHAVEDALNHITNRHIDIDYIYVTGDIIGHRVWATSIESNTEDMMVIFNKLKEYFPNVPIYPILGNHEAHPANVYAPIEIEDKSMSSQWLFELSADLWSSWLDVAALETVRKGGYYTVLAKPRLRIIVINSNVAYTYNWWLIYDDVDPFGQLQWMANVLYEAEQNGEKVHILSHVPSSADSTYTVWSREYRRVIDRFAGVISATFNGHSHYDEFVLYHSLENAAIPIGIAWNGGSLTTASNKNPNYKIYEIDAESFEVLDYDTWMYNVTSANLTPDLSPDWYKLYSFKDAYGLNGAAPSDLRELAMKMVSDRSFSEQYFRYRVRDADTALASGCSSNCLRNQLCESLKSEFADETQCDEILENW